MISWIAWLLSFRIDAGVVNGFEFIASAGPALAAMIVSSILRPEPSGVSMGKRWRWFALIAILALAAMAVLRLWLAAGLITVAGRGTTAVAYPTLTALLLDIVAATVVAFVLSGVHSPRQGVRELLHSLDVRGQPVRWYWWAIAVGFYPLVIVLGNAITAGVGLPQPAPNATGLWYWLVLDALIMSLYGLFGGGGLEEPGWRGFALPWLQKRYSPLLASLILAVIWAFWHWPLLQVGPLDMVLYLVLEVAPLAILFTAVFNRSGGSLPIVMLLHVSINMTGMILPVSILATSVWKLLIVALALWMWRSPHMFSYRQVENK
jgi:membrane protease YdiL (CAAX protease family)